MRSVLFIIPLVFTLLTNQAVAFDPTTTCPKLPQDPIKAQLSAGELFAKAENDYKESRPIDALQGFLCSYHIIQHENTLFNIAQIAKVSELKDQALQILKDYVKYLRGRSKVEPINELISELEGEQSEEQEKQGPDSPFDAEETALAKEDGAIDDSAARGDSTEKIRSAAKNDLLSDKSHRNRQLKVAAITLTAAGGAGLVAGGILQILAAGAQGRAEETDDYSVFEDEKRSMEQLQIGAIAGFVAGGVLLGTGFTLFIVARPEESRASPVSLSLTAAPECILITGRF